MKKKGLKKSCEICQNSINIEKGGFGGKHTPPEPDVIENCKKVKKVAKKFGVDYVWEIELDIYDLAQKCPEFESEYFKKCQSCNKELNIKKTEVEHVFCFYDAHPCCSKECVEELEKAFY